MALTRIRAKGQLTLPHDVRRAARLSEGDYVEVSVRAGSIVLEPKTIIDASKAWFWTDSWQAGERAASEDIAAGRTRLFDSDEDFLASLD